MYDDLKLKKKRRASWCKHKYFSALKIKCRHVWIKMDHVYGYPENMKHKPKLY